MNMIAAAHDIIEDNLYSGDNMTDALSASPLYLNIPDAISRSGLGRTALYNALKEGRILARKAGRRTVISASSLHSYLEALPIYQPQPCSITGAA